MYCDNTSIRLNSPQKSIIMLTNITIRFKKNVLTPKTKTKLKILMINRFRKIVAQTIYILIEFFLFCTKKKIKIISLLYNI